MKHALAHLEPRRPALAFAATALIILADAALRLEPPRVVAALIDEPAHAATALLLLRALHTQASLPTILAVALASVLIDADHIPLDFFDSPVLTRGSDRPYTHSLAPVAACLALASGTDGKHRRLALALAFGLAAHLFRDLATGGTPLLWPLTPASVRYPYPLYIAALLAAVAVVTRRQLGPERLRP